jgi:hypothetical protein
MVFVGVFLPAACVLGSAQMSIRVMGLVSKEALNNAFRGIFRARKQKMRFSVSFIFNRL